jgi:hypothetical protein
MDFIKQEKEIYLDNQTTIEFLDKAPPFSKTTTIIIDRDRFLVAKSLQIENGKKYFVLMSTLILTLILIQHRIKTTQIS